MKIKKIFLELMIGSLVTLFSYMAFIKIKKFEEFKLSIDAQPLAVGLKSFLIYAVPTSLIIAVILLAIPKLRKFGLLTSLALFIFFNGYIALIQLNYYGVIPCSCAGISHQWSWMKQFYFNLGYITITGISIWLENNINKIEHKRKSMRYSAI